MRISNEIKLEPSSTSPNALWLSWKTCYQKLCRTRNLLHSLPTIQNHFCVKEISKGQAGVAM